MVDLYCDREIISGLPAEMADEIYLMKPKVLKLRTWVFHGIWEENKGEVTRDEAIQMALDFPLNEYEGRTHPHTLSPSVFLFLAL